MLLVINIIIINRINLLCAKKWWNIVVFVGVLQALCEFYNFWRLLCTFCGSAVAEFNQISDPEPFEPSETHHSQIKFCKI